MRFVVAVSGVLHGLNPTGVDILFALKIELVRLAEKEDQTMNKQNAGKIVET